MNADFNQSIIGLKQNEVSQPVALPGNKLALAVVSGIVPSRPETLDEAKDAIKETITGTRLTRLVQDKATELMNKAKATGDLEKAAKSMGLEVKTSAEFGRTGTVEGLGTATYLQDGFRTPDGSLFGPIAIPDGQVVAKVVQHVTAPDMAQDSRAQSATRFAMISSRRKPATGTPCLKRAFGTC